MDKFPDTYSQLKLNQETINHLNSSIVSYEIIAVAKTHPKKNPGPDESTLNATRPLRMN
jgi:hypothetical protein